MPIARITARSAPNFRSALVLPAAIAAASLATAVVLLHEPVQATTVLGGLIVLAGVFLVQGGAIAADRIPAPKVASGDLTP